MLPCKKILSAIDFSEASFEALNVANELASRLSSELLLVHVRHPACLPPDLMATHDFDMQAFELQQINAVREKLENVAETRVDRDINKTLTVKEGEAGHEILETAENESVDLIVIASHGMSGLHHYLHGSVAQRVIRHTPCAVLVVRSHNRHKKIVD